MAQADTNREEPKREFKSIEEAFDSLPQKEREHCVRASEYAEEIFLLACASEIYIDDVAVRVRLKPELREAVMNGTRWMNTGKALVPELYHNIRPDFSPEELALYRKHTNDGAKLAEGLLAEKMSSNVQDLNIIMEAIESHHELWGGGGFPSGEKENRIPIIGRIASIANMLDHFAIQKHSEKPFDYAVEQLIAGSGKQYDPVLVGVVSESRGKLKRIFTKYINQSRAIPVSKPVIRRTQSRPFSLWYRPITEVKQNKNIAYEAEMRFADKDKDKDKMWEAYSEVEHIVRKEKLGHDLGLYFIVELCDMLKRMDTCGIPAAYIAWTPPPGWLNLRGLHKEVSSTLSDMAVDPVRLCIIVPVPVWEARTKTMQENLKAISELGCGIMFSGFNIGAVTLEELKENGAAMLRISREACQKLDDRETTDYLTNLAASGLTLLADGIDKKRHLALLSRNKIALATSLIFGDYQPEDSVIESELAALEA
jgi:EAL domain-containing protein (putative c-di-GMP-specific phosphodiesterase class I)